MSVELEALLAGVGPALVWLVLVYTRDRYGLAPKRLIAKLFAVSLATLIVAGVLELLLGLDPSASLLASSLSGAVGVGLVEEGAKVSTLWFVTRRDQLAAEPLDAMVYASSVALGFAAFETTVYILAAYAGALALGASADVAAHHAFLVVAPLRAFTGALGHMSFTGIVGHAYGMFRAGLGSPAGLAGAFFIAVSLHAAYDWLLVQGYAWLAFGVLGLAVAYYARLLFHAVAVSRYLAAIRA